MQEGGRRQHDAIDVADRIFQRLLQRECRPLVVLGFDNSNRKIRLVIEDEIGAA